MNNLLLYTDAICSQTTPVLRALLTEAIQYKKIPLFQIKNKYYISIDTVLQTYPQHQWTFVKRRYCKEKHEQEAS